jgi:1,2-phenylacetyl-CoA epoxidase catalytic subunit
MPAEPRAETMPLEDYLAAGGRLTSPENAPPRYRGELMRLMAVFVDSELAGAAGFADRINDGPGLAARYAAARIVAEKLDHAGRALAIMGAFGADTGRYAAHHPWTDRLPRDADLAAARGRHDLRLPVFHFPLAGWADAVAMNALQGLATVVQLEELAELSYQPLADTFRAILPRERRHMELGLEGLAALAAEPAGRSETAASLAYWRPRVAAGFGLAGAARFATLARLGLRRTPNETLLARWRDAAEARLAPLGLGETA